MQEKAATHFHQKVKNFFEILTDTSGIKKFDYEAFISFVVWSTLISVIRYVAAVYASTSIGLFFLEHTISKPIAFHCLYIYLPALAFVASTFDLEGASLTDRRIIVSFIFVFIGLMAGYSYPQKFDHGSGDFFLPLLSNFLFYFLAQNLKDQRLILLGICVFVPASISLWYAHVFHSFTFFFFVNLIQSSFYIYFCLQVAIRSYSQIGRRSERDIFKTVVHIALISEFLGSLSFLGTGAIEE